jgi:PBSX family phage portal protein
MAEEKKAFGGAKVIYIASPVQKESAQTEPLFEDEISRPYDSSRGDLVEYYSGLTTWNAYHGRSLRVKVDCTVGLGVNVLNKDPKKMQAKFSSVNERGESLRDVLGPLALDFETTGNAYLEVVRSRGGKVGEIYHCPSFLVTQRRRGSNNPPFVYRNDTDKVEFAAYREGEREENSLLFFRNFTLESRYYGLPDWRGAVSDIELDYYAALYNKNFFINSGIPDLAIIVQGGEFDEPTEKKVVEFFQQNLKGVENAHKTLYLPINGEAGEIEVKFEKLAMDMKNQDASFDKLRARCRDNIVSAHGVPPRLVGIVTAGQLGGGGENEGQLKSFQEITIAPRQSMFKEKLDPVFRELFGDLEWDFEKMDTSTQEEPSTFYPTMVQSGILTRDEARADLGYEPLDEPEETEEDDSPQLRLVKTLEGIRKGL